MMGKNSHAIDELELMAYLDGELPRERAAAAAAHLEACAECKTLASDLRGVSQEMASWQIESSAAGIPARLSAALEDHERTQPMKSKQRVGIKLGIYWPPRRAWIWAGGTALALILVASVANVSRMSAPGSLAKKMLGPAKDQRSVSVDGQPVPEATPGGGMDQLASEDKSLDQIAKIPRGVAAPKPAGQPDRERTDTVLNELPIPSGPMVIRTAELALTTTDFDQSRKRVEEILKRHRGYLGDLTVSGAAGSARTLTATLRVPADQLDPTLTELKNLGRVESESQKGEEVTQQYVDLQARLLNARNSEQRLTELLRRAGKLSDVLAVEEQIEDVRESIERMEAERKNMAQQVAFSTLNMTIKENYKESVQVVPDSTSTRIRNGAVEGYEMMVAGLINLLLFLVSWGPSLLLWGAILFWPARWLWKRARRDLL